MPTAACGSPASSRRPTPGATSQVALPEEACTAVYATAGYETSVRNLAETSLTSDIVFGDDGGAAQLGTVTGSVDEGYTVELAVAVDLPG